MIRQHIDCQVANKEAARKREENKHEKKGEYPDKYLQSSVHGDVV